MVGKFFTKRFQFFVIEEIGITRSDVWVGEIFYGFLVAG